MRGGGGGLFRAYISKYREELKTPETNAIDFALAAARYKVLVDEVPRSPVLIELVDAARRATEANRWAHSENQQTKRARRT